MALVYLDSCVFIAAFEAVGDQTTAARDLLERMQNTRHLLATSELTIAELLAPTTRPKAMSIEERKQVYLPLMLEGDQLVDFIPVSREILLRTSDIRAAHPQRLPDALHIATALSSGCRFFLSSDRDARRIPDALAWMTPVADDIEVIARAAGV